MIAPIVFDIETGPLPEWEIAHLMPEFEGRTGTKDPEKIEAQIAEKQAKWFGEGALHANRGQVLAIGYQIDGSFDYLAGPEATMLKVFWGLITSHDAMVANVIGFNSNSFDIPFLIRRSWKLGVKVPPTIVKGRYLNPMFIDLLELWRCGDRQTSISLDGLSKFFGLQGKNGDGALFFRMWDEDKATAIDYLKNDLFLTEQCARFMGVIN